MGGKGKNLIVLAKRGFCVPSGFVIKSSVFDAFASRNSIFDNISEESTQVIENCEQILEKIDKSLLDKSVVDCISRLLENIRETSATSPLVAVRSSGVNEDLDDASFAGMNETVLNVECSVDSVCIAVKECWKSLYCKQAVTYRQQLGFPVYHVSMAVVIQVMIPSDISGVVFTADPQSGSRGWLVVNGVQGMGEALVSGQVDTDYWIIRKSFMGREKKIIESRIGSQAFKLCSNYPNPGTHRVDLSSEEGKRPCLTEELLFEVASTAQDIEKLYGKPMDIEFTFYQNKLYILQARPITNLGEVPPRKPCFPLF